MRNLYWDVVKGSGVFLVLFCHTGMVLNPYLQMYLLSLFFFVAGYFYNFKYNAEPCRYIARKLENLWLPTVRYAMVFLLLHNVLLYAGFYTDRQLTEGISILNNNAYPVYELKDFIWRAFRCTALLELEELPSALWFLPMMFFDLLILCCSLNLYDKVKKYSKLLASLAVAAIWCGIYLSGTLLIRTGMNLDWHMQVGMVLLAPVVTGLAYRRWQDKIPGKSFLPAAGLCFIVAVYHVTGIHVELSQNQIISPVIFPLVTTAGFAFHLGMSHLCMKSEMLVRFFALVGKHGLFIIATHFFAFRLVSLLLIKMHNLPMEWLPAFPCIGFPIQHGTWWIFYVAGGVLIPVIMAEAGNYIWRNICSLSK